MEIRKIFNPSYMIYDWRKNVLITFPPWSNIIQNILNKYKNPLIVIKNAFNLFCCKILVGKMAFQNLDNLQIVDLSYNKLDGLQFGQVKIFSRTATTRPVTVV